MMTTRRTLVFAPAPLAEALPRLPVFAALARSGRAIVGLFREGQAAFEPTLLRWRKEFAPAELALPIALPWGGKDGVSRETLARLGCGEAILLDPADLAAAVLARRLGIAERWGYGGSLGSLLLSRRVARPRWRERPLGRRDDELLAALGLTPAAPSRLDIPRGWPAVGRERLGQAKIDLARPLIGIYAGTAGGHTAPGWPRAAFEALIGGLRRHRSDFQIVIFAQLEDLWQAVRIFENTGKIHPVLGPDLPLSGLLAVLTQIRLLIAGDSALLHLAGALGVPTLGLFEKEAALRSPAGEQSAFLERRPLRTLAPETVLEAAIGLLAR